MTSGGGGWMILQRRVDATVDFYLNWTNYKNGFGDLNGSYWYGLENIHQLAKPGKGAHLRIDLIVSNVSLYANYSKFEIGEESHGYNITVSGYSGDAVDIMKYHNGMKFATKDKDTSDSCAFFRKGGWWHNEDCDHANLNAIYRLESASNLDFMVWNSNSPVTFSEMKIKYYP